jgi:hypothetical protein
MDFIRAVFPNAKFVVLLRDGRDVAMSAMKKWTSPPDKGALLRRLRTLEIPVRDIPFYASNFFYDVLARSVNANAGYIWGPRFEGIEELRANHSLEAVCAVQWRESVKAINKSLSNFEDDCYTVIKYEELVDDPEGVLQSVMSFCDLKWSEDLRLVIDEIKSHSVKDWRDSHNKALIRSIEGHMEDELVGLGYCLSET